MNSSPDEARGLENLLPLLKRKFVRDTFFLQAGTLFTAGTYLLTSILLARHLGAHELGRYGLADRIYTFCFFLANMSLVNVTVVHYSQATGKKSVEGQIQALAAFLKLYLIMIAAILVLGFYLCPLAGEAFYQDREVGIYGWVLCFIGLFDVVRAMALAVLYGLRNILLELNLSDGTAGMVNKLLVVVGVLLFVFGTWAAIAAYRLANEPTPVLRIVGG